MSKIISTHSFKRGVGRTNLTANLATLLSLRGQRVGVVDANFQSPSLHFLFNLTEQDLPWSLNDYLWGNCDIEQTAYDVSALLGQNYSAQLFLIPGNINLDEIAQALHQGHDVKLLHTGLEKLIERLKLDVLMIDTQHGLNEATLFTIALSDVLLLILRTDHQDFRGTDITVELARKLEVPQIMLIVNEVPATFDFTAVKAEMEQIYQCEVVALLPHYEEMMALGSAKIFVLNHPEHPLTGQLNRIADQLLA